MSPTPLVRVRTARKITRMANQLSGIFSRTHFDFSTLRVSHEETKETATQSGNLATTSTTRDDSTKTTDQRSNFSSLHLSHQETIDQTTSTAERHGDVTTSSTERDSYTRADGTIVYASGNGKTTAVAYDAKIDVHQTSGNEATRHTTGTRAAGPGGTAIAQSTTVGSDVGVSDTTKHAVIERSVNGGAPTVSDVTSERADVRTDAFVVNVESASKTTGTGDERTTVSAAESQSAGTATDAFVVSKDGTIVSGGKTISVHELGVGTNETHVASTSVSASVTASDVDRKKNGDYSVSGTSISTSETISVSDTERTFEGVLSSTSADGKTTVRYIDITEETVSTDERKSISVDRFQRSVDIDRAAAQKSDHDGNTTVTTSVTDSLSATVGAVERTDSVAKVAAGATLDTVSESRASITAYASTTSAHTGGANGVDTTSKRSVVGDTAHTSVTDASVLSATGDVKTASGDLRTIDRETIAHTLAAQTSDAVVTASSSSTNGVSVTSRDAVSSISTDERFTVSRFHETIRTVVFATPVAGDAFRAFA